MAFAIAPANHGRPLGEINTTPLIDVLLVLLVMLVITIPVATHSIEVDVAPSEVAIGPLPVSNQLNLTADDRLTWNGTTITDGQLVTLLARSKSMATIPELHFEPSADASYQRSDDVLKIIRQSRIVAFGFVGNDRYAKFGRAGE